VERTDNIKLAPAITALYQCPEETQANATGVSYVVVVGKGTMWPGRKSISFSDVKDGTSSTIMVVEVAGSNIVGSEPRDLDYEQFPLQLNSPLGGGISSLHGKTWHLAMVRRPFCGMTSTRPRSSCSSKLTTVSRLGTINRHHFFALTGT